jgi:hypothetical protein
METRIKKMRRMSAEGEMMSFFSRKKPWYSFFLLSLLCLNIGLLAAEPGFSGIEGGAYSRSLEELRVLAENEARNERSQNSSFKDSTHLSLAVDIGKLTELFMESETSGDSNPFQVFAKSLATRVRNEGLLAELSQVYQSAPPNVREALDPVLQMLRGAEIEKKHGSDAVFSTQSLMELSDLWALPVFRRSFPGYGKRKLWLKYKRGRLTRKEVGEQDVKTKESRVQNSHSQEILVPASLVDELKTRYPQAIFMRREKALGLDREITVQRFRVPLKKGDHLRFKKVKKTRFDWYRLIASPSGLTILPLYMKVGEYYISRELKNSKFFLIGF